MGDLAEKQARNEALRAELSALRIETENANLQAHDVAHEQKLDGEAESLEAELKEARRLRDAVVQGDGSVVNATAAMRAAAGTPQPAETAPTETTPTEAPVQVMPFVVAPMASAEAEKDEEK